MDDTRLTALERLDYFRRVGWPFVTAGGWRILHTRSGWRMAFGLMTPAEIKRQWRGGHK